MTDSGFSWPSMVPLLQGGGHFGPGHRGRQDADLAEGRDVDGVFRGADLQALGVGRRLDRAHVVGQVAEALFAPGQGDDAAAGELGQHVLADLAVQHRAGVRQVAQQEGDIENPGFGNKIEGGPCRNDRQVDGADLQPLDDLAFAAQRVVGELLHLVLAARRGFDGLGHGVRAGAVVRRGRQGVGHLQGVLRRGGQGSDRPAGGQDRGCKPGFAHCLLQYSICSCRGVAPQ